MKLDEIDILCIVSNLNALVQTELENNVPKDGAAACMQTGRVAGILHAVTLLLSESIGKSIDKELN